MQIQVQGEEFILDKEKAIYYVSERSLIISDLHLGKSAHFRKSGLQIPNAIAQNDLVRLGKLLNKYNPSQLIITGDMFHHDLNSDIDEFLSWKEAFKSIKFILIKGNHDRLTGEDYTRLGINVLTKQLCIGPFCFIHEAPCVSPEGMYPISGHIHPGISIVGKAKQRLRLPCYFFGEKYAILPAFSNFTGLSILKPLTTDRVYAITPSKVIALK